MPFSLTIVGADTGVSCCETCFNARMVVTLRRLAHERGRVRTRCLTGTHSRACSPLGPAQHWPQSELDVSMSGS